MRKILPIISLLVISFLLLVRGVAAQIPPPYIDCNQTDDPEFHSLRPYQASPCKSEVSETAEFCGDSLSLTDDITVTYDPSDPSCHPIAGDKVQCNYTIRKTKSVAIDLSEAELPIMGNTELVKNSQTNKEELDDAQKVNEYVSWYLNGVIDRAEYGETDINKVIDFSGPIKKLLPQTIQESERIKTIKNAKKDRHNQIVVCGKNSFGFFGDIFNIGSVTPQECYKGNNSKAQGDVFRLIEKGGAKGWDGDLSWWNDLIDEIVGRLVKLLPDIPEKIIRESVLHHWNKRIPPLPWENDPFAKPERQMTALEYRKYYNEWQGKTCVIVPLLNWLVCFDNILIPNKYADLFPYIPLSSTEDRKGEVFVDSSSITSSDSEVKIISVNFTSADLYFSHLEEAPQLADTLQNTFAYKDADKAGPATSVAPPDTGGRACQVVDVRSNEGDNLFAGEIGGSFTYEASFSCIFDPAVTTPQTCSKSATINIGIKNKTPKAEEAWSRLVAGPAAVFKRIYPQMNENSPIQCLADIPAATNVNYSGDVNQSGELYFPHIGGISEYFLKGIQTILRPKGYGEPIASGTNCSKIECGELPNLPKASGSCQLGSISPRVGNIPQSLKDIIEAASETYKTPPNLILGIMYGEGLFNPGRFNWTDGNVKNWATCTPVPGCNTSGDDNFMGFNGDDWANIAPKIKNDLLKLDPNRKNPSQCNLLDAVYGLAWNLHDSADGGMAFTCFGINLNAPIPSSCTWNNNQYESAIKIHESGYTNMCLTKEGSCLTGGGTDAVCPGGDTCETISNRYANPSHNGCVWDVAHGK